MGRRIKVEERFYREEFLKAARKHRDARESKRLLGLHQVQQGASFAQVGERLGVHWRSVQNWVRRYKAGGLARLENPPGQGKKPRRKADMADAFKRRLIEHPQMQDGGR